MAVLLVFGSAVITVSGLCYASPLDRVLEFVPQEITEPMIMFTNWDHIKDQVELGFVTSSSPLELRIELVTHISEGQAAASVYGLSHIRTHAEEWGWDTADLEWEANIISQNLPPTYILKFRDEFDFAPLIERFLERGFIQTESLVATIFSHELDLRADWARTTELSIHETAYLAEESMLILSSFGVEAFLAVAAGEHESLTQNTYARAAITQLGDPYAAILLLGIGECRRFTPNPILDRIGTIPTKERIDELMAMIEESQLLVPYRALGVGYRYEEARPIGTIAFEYDAPELAEMDLFARCVLAEEGTSTYFDAPIAESYFTILDCGVQDSGIVLAVAPINNQPSRLFRMIFHEDAVFAGCAQ
ncbi:hypothetical protein ACFLSW_02990 [Candidatus Bipolaricaulota bacterium]